MLRRETLRGWSHPPALKHRGLSFYPMKNLLLLAAKLLYLAAILYVAVVMYCAGHE